MVNLRIYRLLCVPFVLALIVAAFSLTDRPRPLSSQLAPDAFDGRAAAADLDYLSKHYAQRRPGSPGDDALARFIAQQFAGSRFETHVDRFTADTVAGRRTIENVIGTRAGLSPGQIVIVAHRDAAHPGSAAELSATAALEELTSVLAGRVLQHPVTLVSTSGGSGGNAGAAELARTLQGPVAAVIVIGDIGGARARRPYVVPWSDGSRQSPVQLRRTVEAALETQLGRSPGGTAISDQLVRLAFPLTLGEQGPLLAAGLPAVLVQRSGEVGPQPGDSVSQAAAHMTSFGRGILTAVSAIDAAPSVAWAPTRDLLIGSRVMPAWPLALLVLTAILPVALSSIDILARARRRRAPVARWLGWLALTALPFALARGFAALLGRTGLLPAAPGDPVGPRALPIGSAGTAALISVLLVFALTWLLRAALVRRLSPGDLAGAVGAPTAMVLSLSLLALVVWVFNPLAAALLVLPLHLWMLATMLEPPPRRAAALAMVLVALIPLALMLGLYAQRLGLNPLAFAWMALLLVAGGHVGIAGVLAWSIAGGCLVAAIEVAARRAAERPEAPPITVRGPISYAGPGSLGGTDSALRR